MDEGEPDVAAGVERDAVDTTRVDELFREVDDRFGDLERQYAQARSDLRPPASAESDLGDDDPTAASAARFELVSQVAALRAEVELRESELDERDALLAEFSERTVAFEQRVRSGEAAERALTAMRGELHDERREVARLRALLEARATERQELAEVTQRLQNEKNHLDTLLSTALQRFDEAEQVRTDLGEKLTRLEAARETEAADHQDRYHELSDARAEMRRLAELVEELTMSRDEASRRADKAESRFERRANEVNYLNRRIDSLSSQLDDVESNNGETTRLQKENLLLARKLHDAEVQLSAKVSEAVEARTAADRAAVRAAEHDQLMARIAELEAETGNDGSVGSHDDPGERSEVSDLVARARDLGSRRGQVGPPATPPAAARRRDVDAATPAGTNETDGTDEIGEMVDAVGAADAEEPATPGDPAASGPTAFSDAADVAVAPVELADESSAAEVNATTAAEGSQAASAPSASDPAAIDAPFLDLSADLSSFDTIGAPSEIGDDASALDDDVPVFQLDANRRRAVLPPHLKPDTADAFQFLIDRPGVVAVVDARSFCKRTGARPSELFHRLEALRDRYDLPIEVVLTPVSTPVGGAPDLAAVGVHHVVGSDTVADRVRALCTSFPQDQPIVVIAGDDHVRRASIAEEANVVDPAVVLDVT